MIVYFFCAHAKDKHFDGSIQRESRVQSNEEYNELKENLKAQISVKADVDIDEIRITALNLI